MDDALVDEDMKLLIDNMEQIAATMDGILVEVQNLPIHDKSTSDGIGRSDLSLVAS